jgi:hypothetical protein
MKIRIKKMDFMQRMRLNRRLRDLSKMTREDMLAALRRRIENDKKEK